MDGEREVEAGIVAVLEALNARVGAIATEAVREIAAEIPSYQGLPPTGPLYEDVHAHASVNIEAFLDAVRASRPPDRSKMTFLPPAVTRRVDQGIELEAVLHAFRVGHRVTWDAIRRQAAALPDGNSVALALARPAMEYIDSVSTLVAETYVAARQEREAEADLAQRDELDRLLTGRAMAGGRIEPDGEVIVVVASAGGAPGAVGRAARSLAAHSPKIVLTVATGGDEVVAVLPASSSSRPAGEEAVLMVRAVAKHLGTRGVTFRAGTSLPCKAPAEIPRAHAEAAAALAMTGSECAVLPLSGLSPYDYLLRRADETARRIVSAPIRELVEAEDHPESALVETLTAWTDSDLNVRRTAERLHVHPNTVHQRLRRIEERTALDLHRFSDVVAITVAIRLLDQ